MALASLEITTGSRFFRDSFALVLSSYFPMISFTIRTINPVTACAKGHVNCVLKSA